MIGWLPSLYQKTDTFVQISIGKYYIKVIFINGGLCLLYCDTNMTGDVEHLTSN